MAAQNVFFQGKAKWAKFAQPNKFGKWSVDLYFTTADYAKFIELKQEKGFKNVVKKDDDGYYVTFSRPVEKIFAGKRQGLAPPQVLDKDGKVLQDALVGNGSDITVKCELYSYMTPTKTREWAIRLLSVRVDNLIPYTIDKDFDPEAKKAVEGLSEQPEQLF